MYDLHTDLRSVPNYSGEELDRFLAQSAMRGMGNGLELAGRASGINHVFLMALAILESGWGKSKYARERNNYVGYMAYDSNPDAASFFSSPDACMMFIGRFVANSYLRAPEFNSDGSRKAYPLVDAKNIWAWVGQWYGGEPTPHGVFVHYSSAHDAEAATIVQLMNQFVKFATTPVGGPVDEPVVSLVSTTATTMTYVVKPGDNLWDIAGEVYGNNAQWTDIAHGNGLSRPYTIHPGQTLVIPGRSNSNPSPVQDPGNGRTHVVQAGETLWGIALRQYGNGSRYVDLFNANRDLIQDPGLIQPGWVLKVPD